jgi:hypothetical protein
VVIKKADLTSKYWIITTGLRMDTGVGVDFGPVFFR